jgi:hypothetical protein
MLVCGVKAPDFGLVVQKLSYRECLNSFGAGDVV